MRRQLHLADTVILAWQVPIVVHRSNFMDARSFVDASPLERTPPPFSDCEGGCLWDSWVVPQKNGIHAAMSCAAPQKLEE